MNPAVALSLAAATLNLGTGLLFLSLSRAPGWRSARWFAAIALSAGLYSVVNVFFCQAGFASDTYVMLGRVSYLAATAHAVGWLVYAFGGPHPSLRASPRWVQRTAAGALLVGLFFAITGLHIQPTVTVVEVSWAGVRYHYPLTTRVGDVYGVFLLAAAALPFGRFALRARRGEAGARVQLAGWVVFFLCMVDEALVASRQLDFLSLGDLGFVSLVLPVSVELVRRFVADAQRLADLTGQLEGEVRERTQERDRAHLALAEAERLAALGRFAAGVGHQVNNPLLYLKLGLQRLEEDAHERPPPAEVAEALAEAQEGARRIQQVVEELRVWTGRAARDRASVDLRDVARAALRMAAPHLREGVSVVEELSPTPRVLGDEPRLVQAVVNLLVNGAQAVREAGAAGTVTVRTLPREAGEVCVEVEDTGPGIPAEHRPRLSEPYFTTRATSGGLGLGLFVTRGIVDAHGGRLELDPAPGGGTRARLVLPAQSGPALAAAPGVPAA